MPSLTRNPMPLKADTQSNRSFYLYFPRILALPHLLRLTTKRTLTSSGLTTFQLREWNSFRDNVFHSLTPDIR